MTDKQDVCSAFADIIKIWHTHVDEEIVDHHGFCTHPECDTDNCTRPSTAADYFIDHRGWDRETIDNWQLGYAPSGLDVAEILQTPEYGYSEETIRATGLFTQSDYDKYDLQPLFVGRYIFPYFNADGEAVYAIARTTGSRGGGDAGYDGHPDDFLSGKYGKVAHNQDYCLIEEPFFGLNTLDDDDAVVIAEGIADAITAAEAGHAVLSPVTTQFKQKHFDPLCDTLEEHNVADVVVIPDSEEAGFSRIDSEDIPESPEHIFETVNIPACAPGLGGSLRTANYLTENGIDARVAQLPRAGLSKVDLDDYLHGWHTSLDPVIASAKPPHAYTEYETATATQDTTTPTEAERTTHPDDPHTTAKNGRETALTREGASALWDLDVGDVNDNLTAGYRGRNPLGHTGESETYFVVYEKPLDDGSSTLIGKDYKRAGKPSYTGCTYLLVEQGERPVNNPEGALSPKETWIAWSTARKRELIDETDVIPTAALEHIADAKTGYPMQKVPDDHALPTVAHNMALKWLENRWRVEALDIEKPYREKSESATARNFRQPDENSTVHCWKDARYWYSGKNENKQLGRHKAVQLLRNKYDFLTTSGDSTLFVYDSTTGTYTTGLARVGIHTDIETGLGVNWSTHEFNEITTRLEHRNIVERREFNGRQQFDDPHICVQNGVLNLFTGELKPHSPEYYFVDRVPIEYDPEADVSTYQRYFDEWTNREADKQTLLEIVGHALVPDANERYKKFLILTGDADNGKSVFFRCVRNLLNGMDEKTSNVSNVKLSKMATQRFSNNSVYGHMANIAGEVDGKKIRNTASLKDITGGDAVEIEPKGKDSFHDTINSTMMFAANDPPILGERDKQAIASRIVPVNLPFSFVEHPDENDPFEKQRRPESDLEDELLTESALSGFLKLAVEGVQRLENNHGDVSLPETPIERLERYERTADPMRQFGHECLKNQDGDYVVKADVTTIYKEWASSQGHELGSSINQTLHGALQGMKDLNYTTSRPNPADYSGVDLPLRPWDERKRVVSRVTLTEEGLEYAKNAGITTDNDTTQPEPETPEALAAREPGYGHTFTATPSAVSDGEYTREAQGRLEGTNGTYISFVVPGGNSVAVSMYENDTVRFEDVTLRTNDDGLLEAVINDAVTITEISTHATLDDDAASEADEADESGTQSTVETVTSSQTATDGGGSETDSQQQTDTTDPREQLADAFSRAADNGLASKVPLQRALTDYCEDMVAAKQLIDRATTEGWLSEPVSHRYRRETLPEIEHNGRNGKTSTD